MNVGQRFKFDSEYENTDQHGRSFVSERNGEVVTVIEVFSDPDPDYLVRFADGAEVGVWKSELGEEVTADETGVVRTHEEILAAGMGEERARRLAGLLRSGHAVRVRTDARAFTIVPRKFAGVWCQFAPQPDGMKRVPKNPGWRDMSESDLVEWLRMCTLVEEKPDVRAHHVERTTAETTGGGRVMKNRDDVLQHAATAVRNNADGVRVKLAAFLAASGTDMEASAARALRDALVLQAAGFELSASNGSTFKARVDASVAALCAWGPP